MRDMSGLQVIFFIIFMIVALFLIIQLMIWIDADEAERAKTTQTEFIEQYKAKGCLFSKTNSILDSNVIAVCNNETYIIDSWGKSILLTFSKELE